MKLPPTLMLSAGLVRGQEQGEVVIPGPHTHSCRSPLVLGGFPSVSRAQPPPQPGDGQEKEFRDACGLNSGCL